MKQIIFLAVLAFGFKAQAITEKQRAVVDAVDAAVDAVVDAEAAADVAVDAIKHARTALKAAIEAETSRDAMKAEAAFDTAMEAVSDDAVVAVEQLSHGATAAFKSVRDYAKTIRGIIAHKNREIIDSGD